MKPWLIKSFRGGQSDEDSIGIRGSYKYGHALDIHKRRDSLTCKQAMKHGVKTSDLVKYFVQGSDGTTYAFGNGGTIYTRSGGGTWASRYNDSNGEIKGASEWAVSDGSTYVIWATDTSVSRKQLITTNSGVDWGNASQNWKTDLTSADYHPMKKASGAMMIGNKQRLALYGFDGSWTNEAMKVEPFNIVKSIDERDDYVILGTECDHEAEEGYIWSWITEALNYIQKKKKPIRGVNALITAEIPLLQGGADGEIYVADFVNNTPLAKIPESGQVNTDGVDVENDLAVFGFYGGTYPGIWSYGRRNKNRPSVLAYDYLLTYQALGSTVAEMGALSMAAGTLLASFTITNGSTTEYGIDEVDSATKATAVYESLEFDAGSPHLFKYFRDAHLIMTPLPTGCSVGFKYKADKGSWITAKTPDGSTSYSVAGSSEAIFVINQKAKIMEIGVTLTPSSNSTPEVLAISTYLEDEIEEYGR